jgi:hypothetical protein
LLEIKNGAFYKGQMGKCKKPKNKLYILLRKAQGKTPLNRKGNKKINKKNDQWCPISKR